MLVERFKKKKKTLLSLSSEHETDQHVRRDSASPHFGINNQGNSPGARKDRGYTLDMCMFRDKEVASLSGLL